jgi:glycosyltransferase involved in cell wall biosynthesis
MTDPLGQSQVLPYIIGLSKQDIKFTLVSFEKKERYEKGKRIIDEVCNKHSINWQPMLYTKKPPIISTLWDIYQLNNKVIRLHEEHNYSLMHCRSYITSLIGLRFKLKKGLPFIFDMRGFWADERLDGEIWTLSKPYHKWIYSFFKRKEIEFLTTADYSVSLTHVGKNEIIDWGLNGLSPIEVIPCCTDINLFSKANINVEDLKAVRDKLGIGDNKIITYLGSTGTWYMINEMLDFFAIFLSMAENNRALIITKDEHHNIIDLAIEKEIDISKLIIRSSERQDVPLYLSLSSASIFFIKPVFSKKASSATKMGEIMALDIPVICNIIGDNEAILKDVCPQLITRNFSNQEYLRVLEELNYISQEDKIKIGNKAREYYSLDKGVLQYYKIYNSIGQPNLSK